MRILVTGGSGLIGEALMRELLARGHHLRLLSRHAEAAAAKWPGVEPFQADVSSAPSLRGAAEDCDLVLHVAGIVEERPPATFESVNVAGTANVIAEAQRAGVPRLFYVSRLAPIEDPPTITVPNSRLRNSFRLHRWRGPSSARAPFTARATRWFRRFSKWSECSLPFRSSTTGNNRFSPYGTRTSPWFWRTSQSAATSRGKSSRQLVRSGQP